MIDVNEILSKDSANDIVESLRQRTTTPPNWEFLVTQYDPERHEIKTDNQGRKDKLHSDGTVDKAERHVIGLEKLLSKRMTEFTFSIPVKRIYKEQDTEEKKEIAKIIERIYQVAHIDAENIRRGLAYYASCEIFTLWYTKKLKTPHNLYGFPCNFKLKCKTFSPMDGVKIYPLIDEYGEMHALSYEYRQKVRDEYVQFFEAFTADKHYRWKRVADTKTWEIDVAEDGVEIVTGKIPGVYLYRPAPIWDGLCELRKDIEYSISRNSDVIAYNSAPVLKVAGTIVGDENKGETRRVYRVTEGGDVSYVSWNQSVAALEYHVKTLLNLFFMQAQIPDISFENMRSLGNIGYEARKMLFADAHMKVGDESGAWVEFLEREANVIKSFLKKLNVGLKAEDIDSLIIEQVITPFVLEDEMQNITKWKTAAGVLVSPREAIVNAGLSEDPDRTLAEILAYGGGQEAQAEQ